MIHSHNNPFFKFIERTKSHPHEFSKLIHAQVKAQEEMLELYEFREEKGKKAVEWIERFCVLPDGENAGKRVKLVLFQKWILYSILCFYGDFDVGDYDTDGNYIGSKIKRVRVVNDVLLLIGSGNAKTTFVAFLNAYFMFSKEFVAPKLYIGSNAYQQSRLCFDATTITIKSNPVLEREARIVESRSFIEVGRTLAKLTAMSSNGANLEGIVPCFILVDEIHEMLYSKYVEDLKKSTKRDDLLVMETTTQGTVRGGHLDKRIEEGERLLYGTKRNYRKAFFMFVQDVEEEIYQAYNSNDMSVLKKSNPGIGTIVSPLLIRNKIQDMIDDPENKRKTTLTKNFNIPQNSESSYFSESECRTKLFDENILKNAPVFLGLDMAYTRNPTNDLTALRIRLINPLTEERYDKDIFFLPKYWIKQTVINGVVHEDKLDMIKYKSKEDSNIIYDEKNKKYGYHLYAKRGDIVIVDEELIEKLVSKYGEQARFDCTGITEEFMIYYIANLQSEYGFKICKFGLDPNKASKIESFFNANLQSIDKKPICIKFQMEKTQFSNPIIEKMKDQRSRKIVNNNNKLTELHFAEVQTKETTTGFKLVNQQRKRKDGVIAEAAAESAYNVFTTNKDTGEANKQLLTQWWKAYEKKNTSQVAN